METINLAESPVKNLSDSKLVLGKDKDGLYCWIDSKQIKSKNAGQGVILTQLALSLGDQAYTPSYVNAGIEIRKFDQKGHLNWLKRWCKNGFTILQKAAKSGDTVEGALERFESDVLGQDIVPDYVEILLGGNDINSVQNYDDAELELSAMKNEFEQIIELCKLNDIKVIVTNMPNNGMWVMNNAQMWLQNEWERHLIRMGRKSDIAAMINLGPLLSSPKSSWPVENVTLTRSNNIVTINWPGHNLEEGERVIVYGAVDRNFETLTQPVGTDVEIVSGNTLTYENTGPNTSTVGSVVRINVIPEGVSDGTTHFSHYGASKAAHLGYSIISELFPKRDILSSSENDYENLVGSGKPLCSRRPNVGMMIGNGGSKTGTVLPTGNVADGYEVRVVNGTPNSVHCEIVKDNSLEYSQFNWQEIEIIAGNEDCEVSFEISHVRPIVWRSGELKQDSHWVRPTQDSEYVYVNVSGISGTTGTNEPVWPTRVGEQVQEGDLLWECRKGLVPGALKCYATGAYKIDEMTSNSLSALSFGIFDNTTGADSILDFNNNSHEYAPLHFVGEDGHFCTPEAELGNSGNSFDLAAKIRVKANGTVKLKFNRFTIVPVEYNF